MARGTLERAGAYTGSDFRVPVASRGCTSVFTRSILGHIGVARKIVRSGQFCRSRRSVLSSSPDRISADRGHVWNSSTNYCLAATLKLTHSPHPRANEDGHPCLLRAITRPCSQGPRRNLQFINYVGRTLITTTRVMAVTIWLNKKKL